MQYSVAKLVAFQLLVLLCVTTPLVVANKNEVKSDLSSLVYASTFDYQDFLVHLQQFQQIAEQYDNSRSIANGYNASADYVVKTLQEHTDFNVTVQNFDVQLTVEHSPASMIQESPGRVTYKEGRDFALFTYSGAGSAKGPVSNVSDACSSSAFKNFKAGDIAVAVRGNCDFAAKAKMAQQHGAHAIVVYNYGETTENSALFFGTLGDPDGDHIIAFSAPTYVALEWFATSPTPIVEITANTALETFVTRNVIAQSPKGIDTKDGHPAIVVVGAHLDSVPAGPGIVDNGSGSAALLAMALKFASFGVRNVNRLRFCWFGAEEIGLRGSRHYVKTLKESGDIKNIALDLNYDMLSSPNFFRGVYNGKQAPSGIEVASAKIADLYTTYFEQYANLPYDYTPFDGRSDYGPFIENGVPAGGLFTGAEQLKSKEQQTKYGGVANQPYDGCYHQACDNIANTNEDAMVEMSRAAAFVMHKLIKEENLPTFLNNGNPPKKVVRKEKRFFIQDTNGYLI